ncbi:uncharacterized protein PFL1_04469 [Pseudozyma flocculosa PF-1]|nr:uncharacterized protein PFL1_04469 [Pseudozyma flocculosa PF-1]EPQ28142.1 hypothetical protein PFL1_04469 [Pseudozyma flocculosa PF-1]
MSSSPGSLKGFSPVLGPRNTNKDRDRDRDRDRERDGNTSRTGKMRAALHLGSVVDDWPMYSANGDDYIMGDTIGFGASSVVHQGVFKPLDKACAIKVIDLEAYGRDTEELRRETQLMSLSKHPNVLRVRGCWVKGTKLHIASRLMNSGSMLDIMKFSSPEGFDETVIATVLKQALEGLNYLHINGWLHRDLKAANMLVDDDGTVLLGDFGVGVFVGESEKSSNPVSTEGKRKSFVGTPCWMAPEVIERKHYGTKADIWSFGITALELAQGRAPNSRLSPVKVLMRTMQDEPPQLDRNGNANKYSKTMEDFVRVCLQKDPAKRPSADKLLGHAFFKQAKPPKYLITAILAGLPPLAQRQERRRKPSMISTRECMSWDFGSISSRGPTPGVEKTDPFRNFTGVVSLPSPHGSVRSTKLVSIDGQHVLATEEDDDSIHSLSQSLFRRLGSSGGGGGGGGGGSDNDDHHRRELNANSWGKRRSGIGHRKSVSFENKDDGSKASGDAGAGAGAGAEGPSALAASSLEPIGEKSTPQTSAALPSDVDIAPLDIADGVEAVPGTAGEQGAVATETRAAGSHAATGTTTADGQMERAGSVDSDASASSHKPTTSTPATSAPSSLTTAEVDATPSSSPPPPSVLGQSKLHLQRVLSGASSRAGDAASSSSSGGGGGGGGNRSSKRDSVFGKLFKGGSRKEAKA